MTSSSALLKRVASLEKKLDPPREARSWNILLEEGESISEELQEQIGPRDTVIVRFMPVGYGIPTTGQVMSCWLSLPHGHKKPCVVRQYDVDITHI